ncbi:hypothetical protein TeGR_g5432 [Tetraparma gracilis]|uniref:Deacetylase sirtuin-type domain-containing protein n=1 Tax=Tetraparma gracilis TaxID=2962635 RepID=A0ABQ6N8G2_9STRA|nr:hypothetical protein TeGR_g5432 [Tetraparma gracilis]
MGLAELFHSMTNTHSLPSLDLDGVACYMMSPKCRRICVMAGAGISVSAGIPDFRSIATGIYNSKATTAYSSLPTPQHMFDNEYFLSDQAPFYSFFAKDLFPSATTKPTRTHHFLRLLSQKGLLTKMYTQNIDSLERLAGLPPDKIIEVHGSLATASCAECGKSCDAQRMAKTIRRGGLPTCEKCGGAQKPDITFFGEKLPFLVREQMKLKMPDLRNCDLLLVIGTSLAVQPFAGFIDKVPRGCPRVFVNKGAVGSGRAGEYDDKGGQHMWGALGNYRDVLLEGECDRIILQLASKLGWMDELNGVVKEFEGELRRNGGKVDVEGKLLGSSAPVYPD